MHPTETNKEKIKLFIKILWPILITQVGIYAMSLFDTIMSGRVGAADLAGVAIGSSIWMPVFMGLGGILIAVSPIVAQHAGAGNKEEIAKTVLQATYLSVLLSIAILVFGSLFLKQLLTFMGLEEQVEYIAFHYLIGLSFGIIPLFIFSVIRYFFDALGFTRITMFVTLLAVPVNIFFNYVLIFGNLGFPKLGGIGAGYATSITYWLILVISIVVAVNFKHVKSYRLFKELETPSLQAWKEQLKIGIPIGLSIFFEVSIFAAVTLFMSQFSTIIIAAHQAAMNFTSLLFMMPLSIGMALTIAIGYEVGGQRFKEAITYAKIGITTAIGIMLVASVLLFVLKKEIAMMYSINEEVVMLTQQFFIFGIFYQLSDTLQVSIQGVLRGYKDVTVPFITALISYWGVGLPLGYVLANYTPLEPFGYWVGITAGLTVAAIGFILRFYFIQRRYKQSKSYA